MTEKSISMCRFQNYPFTSSSFMNISDFREHSNQTKKKVQQSSKYSSTLAKTTSICSEKNTIRKGDFIHNKYCSKGKSQKKIGFQRKGKKNSEGRGQKQNSILKQNNQVKKKQNNKPTKKRKIRGNSMDDFRKNSKADKMLPIFIQNWKYPEEREKFRELQEQSKLDDTFEKTLKVFNQYQLHCDVLRAQRDNYKTRYQVVAEQLKSLRKNMKKKVSG